MSPEETAGWTLEFETSAGAAPVFLDALASLAAGASSFEAGPGGPWRIAAWFTDMPDHGALSAAVALAAAAAGTAAPDFVVRPAKARDWLAENRASFQPVRVGRFFVHPSFFEGNRPAGALAIVLDAATAFGSGAHGTTRGCLSVLDGLARCLKPRQMLDMGCGSGILAIAMAKAWRRPVLAVDIDEVAVRVTRANARANGVGRLVTAGEGAGFAAPLLRRRGRFDLIVANILARPLQRMAPALAHNLVPGGTAVLSGLLTHQEAAVIAACRAHGLRIAHRIRIETWSTLVLARGCGLRTAAS
ncbi:MAG: 50S ribosomal protein L11 methyltransferase [Rhodospirillales bacterium]|nr:MAG: 50S ribosomal protein L11 methyltransferase [Rhodospirillales bacterium]